MFFHRFTTDWFGFVIYKTCSSTSSPCLLYLLYHGSLRDGNIVKWEVESEQRSHALGLIALRVWKGLSALITEHKSSTLIIYGVWHAKTKWNAYYTEFKLSPVQHVKLQGNRQGWTFLPWSGCHILEVMIIAEKPWYFTTLPLHYSSM